MTLDVPMAEEAQKVGAATPRGLPTLQRNALCKFFERADFTPEEVLAVGYGRLRKVNGIGPKGMEIISAWLSAHGLVLRNAEMERTERHVRQVERAIRLLERYGYEISLPRKQLCHTE